MDTQTDRHAALSRVNGDAGDRGAVRQAYGGREIAARAQVKKAVTRSGFVTNCSGA